MKNYKKTINNEQGASLLGMAILIICLGVFLTGGIYLYQNYHTVVAEQTTKDHKRAIEIALEKYMDRENRLPGPAGLAIAPDAAGFGFEQLAASVAQGIYPMNGHTTGGGSGGSVLVGAVPVRTLEIADEKMFDGYGKRFVYAVSQNMLGGDANGDGVVSNAEAAAIDSNGDGVVSAAEAQVASASIDVFNDMGAIRVTNPDNQDLRQSPNSISFTIFSSGEDDRGAFDIQGNQLAGCGAAAVGADLAAGTNCQFLVAAAPIQATFVTTTNKKFGTNEDFTHSFAFAGNNIPYSWAVGAWSNCAGLCGIGQGTQSRSVTCVDHTGAVAPNDALCSDHTPRPVDNQACDLASCVWDSTAWGTCDGVCFSGIQTRTIHCENHQGNDLGGTTIDGGAGQVGYGTNPSANAAHCLDHAAGGLPATRRSCALGPCTWTTGGWGTCS